MTQKTMNALLEAHQQMNRALTWEHLTPEERARITDAANALEMALIAGTRPKED